MVAIAAAVIGMLISKVSHGPMFTMVPVASSKAGRLISAISRTPKINARRLAFGGKGFSDFRRLASSLRE